ncbi:MAG: NAD(+) diphosphatase [Pseudomonadota bacterium]
MIEPSRIGFLGAGLDRAAHLRGDQDSLQAFLEDGAPVLPVWRGKVMMDLTGPHRTLSWLPCDSPVFDVCRDDMPMFLGVAGGKPHFFQDISAWTPDDLDGADLGAFADPSVQVHPSAPSHTGFAELRGSMALLGEADAELAAVARGLSAWHSRHSFCANCGAPTIVGEAGWHRQCDACGSRHFPRTDPVVIVLVTSGNRILLGRSPGWPKAMYSLLAGFVEPGETLEDAAAREVFEESHIRLGPVHYVACQPWPFPASLMMGMRAEALSTEIKIDPVELEDAIWVEKEDVLNAMLGRDPGLKPAREGAIARAMIDTWVSGNLES